MSQLKMNDGMPQLKLTRSSHNLSNTTCFDVEQGWLVPTAVYDCVPGDRFNLGSQALIRTTALVKPAFTVNLQAKSASFFVAYRTIWKAFEDFFSGGRSGNAKIPLPVFNINDELLQYSIFDYFGLPCLSSNPVNTASVDTTEYINALYLLAYLKIWNDYFRNPSLDIEIDVLNLTIYKPNDDTPYDFNRHTTPFNFVHNGISYIGASVTIFLRWCFGLINNTISLNALTLNAINSKSPNPPDWQKRKYSRPALVNLPRDLFTSALPTASSSDPVSLGFSGHTSFPITGKGLSYLQTSTTDSPYGLGLTAQNTRIFGSPLNKGTLTASPPHVNGAPSTETNPHEFHSLFIETRDVARGLKVESSGGFTSGIYPRELRLVFGLDLKQQIRNLSGNRYQDLLKAFYGVTTRDYRLNLAEYIGGSRYPIYTSEVLQTSETSNTPLGDQAGHAIGSGSSSHGSYFVEELGCILNLFWVNSENVYSQELRRDWRKFSINDYFFPMFEKLGDQELLQEEICYVIKPTTNSSSPISNSKIFGFVPRYSEYKFYNNTVKGGFRGNYRYWSQARFFRLDSNEVRLNLNSSFIKPNSTTFNRIFQTIDNDYTLKPYQVKFVNNTIAFRPMEENTIGYLIDHF